MKAEHQLSQAKLRAREQLQDCGGIGQAPSARHIFEAPIIQQRRAKAIAPKLEIDAAAPDRPGREPATPLVAKAQTQCSDDQYETPKTQRPAIRSARHAPQQQRDDAAAIFDL